MIVSFCLCIVVIKRTNVTIVLGEILIAVCASLALRLDIITTKAFHILHSISVHNVSAIFKLHSFVVAKSARPKVTAVVALKLAGPSIMRATEFDLCFEFLHCQMLTQIVNGFYSSNIYINFI